MFSKSFGQKSFLCHLFNLLFLFTFQEFVNIYFLVFKFKQNLDLLHIKIWFLLSSLLKGCSTEHKMCQAKLINLKSKIWKVFHNQKMKIDNISIFINLPWRILHLKWPSKYDNRNHILIYYMLFKFSISLNYWK